MPTLIPGVNDISTADPLLAKEWNYRKNNDLLPSEVAVGSQKKVWWVCENGHEWQATPNNRHHGNGCPYCSGRVPIPGKTDLATLYPEIVKEWDYQKNENLKPEETTCRGNKRIWWKIRRSL